MFTLINNRFKSLPLVVHAPDDSAQTWKALKKAFFDSTFQPTNPDPRLTILTWNNKNTGAFEASVAKQGLTCHILGQDLIEWNNNLKFDLTIQLIDSCDTEYILAADSHDALLLGSPTDLIDRFIATGADLLFNSERRFYPTPPVPLVHSWRKFQQQIAESEICFLNAGLWMGKREFCRLFFETCRQVRIWEKIDVTQFPFFLNCDQSAVHALYPLYHPQVLLDYRCSLFQNFAYMDRSDISYLLPLL